MKILLDTTTLLSPKGGIGHYVDKISNELINDRNFQPFFLTDNYFSRDLNKIKDYKPSLFERILKKNIRLDYKYKNIIINRFIKKNNIEIFHQPNFIGFDSKTKNIITVHDLSWLRFPEFFLKRELDYFKLFFEKSIKSAFKVIVHSNFVKQELNLIYNISESKIKVIHEDLRQEFKILDENKCLNFLNKYNLKYKKFILILNTLDNRKNYKFILDVYDSLSDNVKKNFPLIIAGMPGRNSDEIINKISKVKNCFYIGYLNENYLNQCYSSAKILIYPSLYEGFGISPLESMASGTPVVASSIESSKEILGESSILVEIKEKSSWIKSISEILDDKNKYEDFVNRGLNKSTNFTKGTTSKNILKLYKELES